MKRYRHIPTNKIVSYHVSGYEVESNGTEFYNLFIPHFIVENGSDWTEIKEKPKDAPRFEVIEISVGSYVIKKGHPDFNFVKDHDCYTKDSRNAYNNKIYAVRDFKNNRVFRIGGVIACPFSDATLQTITDLEIKNDLLKITSTFIT